MSKYNFHSSINAKHFLAWNEMNFVECTIFWNIYIYKLFLSLMWTLSNTDHLCQHKIFCHPRWSKYFVEWSTSWNTCGLLFSDGGTIRRRILCTKANSYVNISQESQTLSRGGGGRLTSKLALMAKRNSNRLLPLILVYDCFSRYCNNGNVLRGWRINP